MDSHWIHLAFTTPHSPFSVIQSYLIVSLFSSYRGRHKFDSAANLQSQLCTFSNFKQTSLSTGHVIIYANIRFLVEFSVFQALHELFLTRFLRKLERISLLIFFCFQIDHCIINY